MVSRDNAPNEKWTRCGLSYKKKRDRYEGAGTNEQATTIISHLFIPEKRHYSLTVNKNAFVIGATGWGREWRFMTNQPPGFIAAYTENYNCI
jgi:hypothetical protein